MRALFIVGIKLIGALSLVSAASTVVALTGVVMQPELGLGTVAIAWLASLVVSAAVVYASIFEAEKVADIFGLPDKGAPLSGFSAKATLRTGFVLIGVLHLLRAVPSSAKAAMSGSFAGILDLALPLALVFGAGKAVDFVDEYSAR